MKTFRGSFLSYLLVFCCSAAVFGNGLAGAQGGVETQRFRWKGATIRIAISTSLLKQNSNIKPDSDVIGAVRRSIDAWRRVANIEFQIDAAEKQGVSPAGNAGDGVSLITIAQTPENILFFSKDSDSASAKTRIFFNRRGFITEADIVLNPFQQFSTDGTFGTYDLESTMTHEVGHLLGLRHSSVLGATMLDNFGTNGVFGISDFGPRTLSESDIASIRELYGANPDADECCGRISGRLSNETRRAVKNLQVWAEEVETGRVIAQVETAKDGSFRLGGLRAGNYALFWKAKDPTTATSIGDLGVVSVENAENKILNQKIAVEPSEITLRHIGFNGQLANFAVPVNGGRSYVVYLGGKNLDAKSVSIDFRSPFFTVSRNSIINLDYGEDISVISFEVIVDPITPAGEYTIFVTSHNGLQACLVGGLTVDETANPWSSPSIPN